jgi:hypothetical protein
MQPKQLTLPLQPQLTRAEQEKAWRDEWQAMTTAQQDRAVETLIKKFEKVAREVKK